MKTLKQKIHLTKSQYLILKDLSYYSKSLYNVCIYICKQYFKQTNQYIGVKNLEIEARLNENFQKLPAQTAQQIIRLVDQNYRSFFTLLRKKGNGKYDDQVNSPKFKPKDSHFNLIYTFQNSRIKNDILTLDLSKKYKELNGLNKKLKLPFTYNINGIVKQILIKPIGNKTPKSFEMYISYEENKQTETKQLNKENYLSIDLGLNNIATCVNSKTGHSFIMNGKPLKSYNQRFNLKKSTLQSELKRCQDKNWSNKLQTLQTNRKWFIDNYFNQVVNYIVKYCISNDIGNLIIGYNETWKNEINIGTINNRQFVSIPHRTLVSKFESKTKEFGINMIMVNESYTSKCSFIDREPMKHQEQYVGKRRHRGLFVSKNKIRLNADVNGSANILRKVIGDVVFKPDNQPIMGLMFNPIKITF